MTERQPERQNDPLQSRIRSSRLEVPAPPHDEWSQIQSRIRRSEAKQAGAWLKRLGWVALPVAATLLIVRGFSPQATHSQLSGELLSVVENLDPLDPVDGSEPLVGEEYLSLLALVEKP